MAGRHRRVHPVSGRGRHRNPPRRGHIVLPSLAVAAVLGIGGVSAGAALSNSHTPDRGGGAVPPPTAMVTTAPPVTSSPAPAPTVSSGAPAPPAATAPDLVIIVTGRVCWVQVVGPHAHVLYAGMLRHGRTLRYHQGPLRVTLGDAGAVRLVLHHHAKPAGRRGQVLSFTYR